MSSTSSKKQEQAFLKVTDSEGTIHLLPYGHILHVALERNPTEGNEYLSIRGAISVVGITGRDLSKLLPGIQDLTLGRISGGDSIDNIEVSIRESED